MEEQAWESVGPTTINNCWDHTGIQQPPLSKIMLRHPHPLMPANLAAGWDIIVQYARESWSLPKVHTYLQEHLSDQFIANKWTDSLDSVLGAEEDTDVALAALHNKWAPDC